MFLDTGGTTTYITTPLESMTQMDSAYCGSGCARMPSTVVLVMFDSP
jgi:hypothetical protein